jgi:hypothetical protein
MVDKVAMGQVFSEYFGFPCQMSFHRLLHTHIVYHPGLVQYAKQWPTFKMDSFLTHLKKLKKKTTKIFKEKVIRDT